MSRAQPRIVVVGAGAFGGWPALELTRRGAAVTVIDAWGPGHVRASSGGETRVIRATYGTRDVYTAMALRALQLWRKYDTAWRQQLLHETGVLWMFGRQTVATDFARASANALRAHGAAMEDLSPVEARRRYPQVAFDSIESVVFEPAAGYLMARRACDHVLQRVVAEGGTYRVAAARTPVTTPEGPLRRLELLDGTSIAADVFVFACGPWLPALLPDIVGDHIAATRQEVYYFGPPAGDPWFTDSGLPVWIDFRDSQIYGIPGNAHRGFKIADDASGPLMDPTTGDRRASESGVAAARAVLALRFPQLADAPLVGSEVCQYESSPDADFIIDRHPRTTNVWIVGGGSGHGFKMGPVIGEIVASLVLGESEPDPRFSLARLTAPIGTGRGRWT